jgi:surface protein
MKKKLLLFGSILLLGTVSFEQESQAVETIHEIKQSIDEKTGVITEDRPIISQPKIATKRVFSTLPVKFDYTTGNVETVMRNQGSVEICWAYSAVDTITTSNKKEFGIEYTLSPNYSNYYTATNAFTDAKNPYGERGLNTGGDAGTTIMQAAFGNNGVLEKDFPTPNDVTQIQPMTTKAFQEKKAKKSPIYIEEAIKIPGVSYRNFTEEAQTKKVDEIKKNVYQHGAVTFSYHTVVSHSEKYYNQEKKAGFVPVSDAELPTISQAHENWVNTNHGVVIVGWDDQFSKSNFTTTPKKDGAFLVKNSWGNGESNGRGYFYLSYEDLYILNSEHYAVDTKMDKYDHLKTYGNGKRTHYSNVSTDSRVLYLGSVFSTEDKAERLEAVSFYNEQVGIDYEVFYVDNAVSNRQVVLNYQDMKKIGSGTIKDIGMKELPTEAVEIDKNKDYTVVVKISYPQDIESYHLTLQEVRDAQAGKYPDLPEGKTFLSSQDDSSVIHWNSISDGTVFAGLKANHYLNAYTNNLEDSTVPVSSVTVSPTQKELEVGVVQQLTATVLPTQATNKKVTWTSSNPSVAVVSETGQVTAKAAGTARITVTTEDGKKTATSSIEVVNSTKVYGTSPWKWNPAEQSITFYQGEFPNSEKVGRITALIERDALLAGKKIKKIIFSDQVKANANSRSLFEGLTELVSIEGIEKLNVSEVVNMRGMFYNVSAIQELNLSSWNVSNVNSMFDMFTGTTLLRKINLSNWDTTNVVDMTRMFERNNVLEELVLGEKTLFKGNTYLTEKKDTVYDGSWVGPSGNVNPTVKYASSVEFMSKYDGTKPGTYNRKLVIDGSYGTSGYVWDGNNQTVSFYAGTFPDAETVGRIKNIVEKNTVLEGKKIRKIIFKEPIKANANSRSLFEGLTELVSIEGIEKLNVSEVVNMRGMFYNVSAIQELNLSSWNVSNVNSMFDMFTGTTLLRKINLSNWDTTNVVDMTRIFDRNNVLEELTLGEKTLFKGDTYLTEKNDSVFTGIWVGPNDTKYTSSTEFMKNYNGANAGVYVREKR